jgi:hypothetical protein
VCARRIDCYNDMMSHNRTSILRISKVVRKVHFGEEKTDADYWRALPYQARIDLLGQLRLEYNQWKYHAQPGFQRVDKIVKR